MTTSLVSESAFKILWVVSEDCWLAQSPFQFKAFSL